MLPHDHVDLCAIDQRRRDLLFEGRRHHEKPLKQINPIRVLALRKVFCCNLGRRLELAGKKLQALA